MKTLLTFLFSLTVLSSFAQYPASRQNGVLVREERYVTNSPGNGIGTSKTIEFTKDSTVRMFYQPTIIMDAFGATRNDGSPSSIAWFDASGNIKRSPLPSWITSESDPVWGAEKSEYSTKAVADGLYYPLNNPSGYITNSALSGYATNAALTTGLAAKFNTPTGTTSQYVRGDGSLATLPVSASRVFNNNVVRSLNSNFTISTTRDVNVTYSISLSVTNPLLAGSSSANAFLEYSTNAGSSWTTVSQITNSSSVALAVTIALTQPNTFVLSGNIPANALVRIRTTTSGTASAVYTLGSETYL